MKKLNLDKVLSKDASKLTKSIKITRVANNDSLLDQKSGTLNSTQKPRSSDQSSQIQDDNQDPSQKVSNISVQEFKTSLPEIRISQEIDPNISSNLSQIKLSQQSTQQPNQIVHLKRPGFVRKPNAPLELEPIDFNQLAQNSIMLSPYNIATCDRNYTLKQIKEIQKNKQQFVDSLFPPNLSMLFVSPQKYKDKVQCKWQSIQKICGKSELSLMKYCDPNDLDPGSFTSIILLSALTGLAEQPRSIRKLIEDQTVNESGVYYVKICRDGVWRYETIDNYFPVTDTNIVMTSHHLADKNIELWGPLIEKALCKSYGNFETAQYCNIKDVLRDLTGAPIRYILVDSIDINFVDEIGQALANKQIIMVGNEVQYEEKIKLCDQMGLALGFWFSCIGMEVTPEQNVLLHFRNPWGWQPDSKVVSDDQGKFTLSIDTVKQIFSNIVIAKLQPDNSYYINRTVRHGVNSYCVLELKKLQNETNSNFIEITQMDTRIFKNNYDQYDYSFARVILFRREEDNSIRYIQSTSGITKTLTLEIQDFSSGIYYLCVIVDWIKQVYDLNITYIGSEKISMERVSHREKPNFICNLYEGEILNHGIEKTMRNRIKEYIYVSSKDRLILLSYVNSTDKELILEKNFQKLQKEKLTLLNFVNESELSGLKYLNESQINSLMSIDVLTNLKISLKPSQRANMFFKIIDDQIEIDEQIVKKLGIS